MNLSTIATIIYAVGIIIGALFLDIWALTCLASAVAQAMWYHNLQPAEMASPDLWPS